MARRATLATIAAALVATVAPSSIAAPVVAHADLTTVSGNAMRQGWVSNETALTPAAVTAGGLHKTLDVTLKGQVYAEPLVVGSSVIVATEDDWVYALDRNSGAQRWAVSLGTAEPANVIGCSDLIPNIGITSTPVYDPSTSTIYVIARTWDGSHASSAAWKLHALSLATGNDAAGWPVQLGSNLVATNDPNLSFDPVHHESRPGLLLIGGRIFAGFGSFCDILPYQGWIASISTTNGSVKMWTDEPTASSSNLGGTAEGGGIWLGGGGLMSDPTGGIFFSTGNGFPTSNSPSSIPPAEPGTSVTTTTPLGESIVRVNVQSDGSLQAVDFFAPHNAQSLSAADTDLASSGVTALPDNFGNVPGHPHLLLVGGKGNVDYLLDRDSLGGETAAAPDNAVAEAGSASAVFGHAAIWPGDGGYIYLPSENISDPCPPSCGLDAYQVKVSGGNASLVRVGSAAAVQGYGTGSPVVTSNGTTSGSALVWQVEMPNASELWPELRTYLPVPQSGTLTMVSHIPLGHAATKFMVPTIDSGQVFIGTADGHLLAFGLQHVYTSVAPFRLADTRSGSGYPLAGHSLSAGQSVTVPIRGAASSPPVPPTATAAVLNVTATNGTHSSYLTVYPSGTSPPLASNLNTGGRTVANLVMVPIGGNGAVGIFNHLGSTDVVVDLEGYFVPGGGPAGLYNPLAPARITDTRSGSGQANAGKTPASTDTVVVQAAGGASPVPSTGVSAVVLNVTAVSSNGAGFLTAFADGASRPTASNLNFDLNQVVPNRVIVPVGANGKVDIYNSKGYTDIVVDVGGWFTDGSAGGTGSRFTPLPPTRIADSRTGSGLQLAGQTLNSGAIRTVNANLPPGAVAVAANVTAADTTYDSFLTVYPDQPPPPTASDLNWVAGQVVPNLVTTKLGNGALAVYNHLGQVDVIVDVFGYWS